jgi:hypothetical protein
VLGDDLTDVDREVATGAELEVNGGWVVAGGKIRRGDGCGVDYGEETEKD